MSVLVGINFAKFGSDYKKPDAITCITKENYKNIVWPLPVSELLYVGKASAYKLNRRAIYTIGDLAERDPVLLKLALGKWGLILSDLLVAWILRQCVP